MAVTQSTNNSTRTVARMEYREMSGPLPDPETLRGFEEVAPGSAERIISMAEKQHAHRIALESMVVTSDVRRSWWGLVAAVATAFGFLAVALTLGLTGHETPAAVIGGTTVVGIVGTFIYGTERRRSERAEKRGK